MIIVLHVIYTWKCKSTCYRQGITWIYVFLFLSCINLPVHSQMLDPNAPPLLYLREDPVEKKTHENIYEIKGVLFCTGSSKAANENNRGAELVLEAKYEDAIEIFKKALRHAPLFYPYHMNIGISYLRLRQFGRARVHLEKAQQLVPENPAVYLVLGELYSKMGNESKSLEYFRKALEINRKELKAIIKIGDVYYNRNQLELARRYYNSALSVDPGYSNGLLGLAKIHYKREEYYKAIIKLKQIDLEKRYDKSYHYYYAECSYKLQDYKEAYYHYNKLLDYKEDPFFITHSYNLIRHKRNLTKRFVDIEEVK